MAAVWIQSKDNPQFKALKQLLTRKYRERQRLYLIEGVRLVDEAIRTQSDLKQVVLSASSEALQERYADWEQILLDDRLFAQLSDTVSSQGVLGVVGMPPEPHPDYTRPMLVLDAVQDPGNLGTIIRTATALGIGQIVMLRGTVDAYNPKVVRSTAGALFSASLVQAVDGDELMETLHTHGYQIVGTALEHAIPLEEIDFAPLSAVLIGNEGRGIAPERLARTDLNVTIPIRGRVESLNAAVAAAIVIYEWGKQLNR